MNHKVCTDMHCDDVEGLSNACEFFDSFGRDAWRAIKTQHRFFSNKLRHFN